ncbi:hypothetical protein AB7M73_010973 [Bradyrhizobium japonicum]
MRVLPTERLISGNNEGAPLPDSHVELPPVIRRTEFVAFALAGLFLIAVVAVLYVARAFFLPVVMAVVAGTMLSPAASFLERRHVPRALGAVLIVIAVTTVVAFVVALIAVPAMEWSSRLPELGAQLKEKMHVFDRPLALWKELQTMVGGSEGLPSLPLPKAEWVQPTLEFLSPTFAEFLLFFATLILFIASWRDLRRALIMNFGDRDARLRTLRILNEIEVHLGNYLLTVTLINVGVGVATGLICAVTGMPNPAGLGALAAGAQLHPDHRTGRDVRHSGRGGARRFPDHRRRTDGGARLRRHHLPGRALRHADHHRAQAFPERACRLHRAGLLDLAVGTDGSIPVVAAPDRRADPEGASAAGEFAAAAAGMTGFPERNLPGHETFSGYLSRQQLWSS